MKYFRAEKNTPSQNNELQWNNSSVSEPKNNWFYMPAQYVNDNQVKPNETDWVCNEVRCNLTWLFVYLKFTLTSLRGVKRANTDVVQLIKLGISPSIVHIMLGGKHHWPFKFKRLPMFHRIAPNLLFIMVYSDWRSRGRETELRSLTAPRCAVAKRRVTSVVV